MTLRDASLAEVAAQAAAQLERAGIPVAVVGGSAVTIHVPDIYTSKDIDFAAIKGTNRRAFGAALAPLGFVAHGRDFVHPECSYTLDLVADTPYVDQRPITSFALLATRFGPVRVYRFEDAIADRIAAFLHWGDSESLDVAERAVKAHRSSPRWPILNEFCGNWIPAIRTRRSGLRSRSVGSVRHTPQRGVEPRRRILRFAAVLREGSPDVEQPIMTELSSLSAYAAKLGGASISLPPMPHAHGKVVVFARHLIHSTDKFRLEAIEFEANHVERSLSVAWPSEMFLCDRARYDRGRLLFYHGDDAFGFGVNTELPVTVSSGEVDRAEVDLSALTMS